MAETVTIKDIARLAGVSIGTVDRVLHGRGRVADETAARIRRIIEETGFSPNPHASSLAQTKARRIGLLMPREDQDSGFWRLPYRGMLQAIEDLAPFKVELLFHPFDRFSESSFLNAGETLRSEEPDGIMLAPIMPERSKELLKRIPQGMPLCCFDSDLPSLEKLAFIGQESHISGKLAAKLMRLLTRDEGTTVIIQAVQADNHILDRVEGFRSYYPPHQIPQIYREEHLDDPKICEGFMGSLVRELPDLAGIFVINASVHGVAAYLEKSGRGDIGLIGYDLIPPNRHYLEKGIIDFLISQRPELQGYRSVMRIFDALGGKSGGEPKEIMPVDILTAENVAYYTAFK